MALAATLRMFAGRSAGLGDPDASCQEQRRLDILPAGKCTIPGQFVPDDGHDGHDQESYDDGNDSHDHAAGGKVALQERLEDEDDDDTVRHAYNDRIATLRALEFPQLADTLYLDHAGTTVPSRSLITGFSEACLTTLYGNPHSGSAGSASLAASRKVEDVRLKTLRWFNADPEDFDVVFVANATAGIKLVAECLDGWSKTFPSSATVDIKESGSCHVMRNEKGFSLGYHADSHTSLVGLREIAGESVSFSTEQELHTWLKTDSDSTEEKKDRLRLLAYPAQSNMTGRKLPLSWISAARSNGVYTILDAAALAATSNIDMSNSLSCADFTVLSFYKMFGMPDLGALIVRKEAQHILRHKRYFGGGTVEMVTVLGEQWHVRKQDSIHEGLEDGTLPVHNITMLDVALAAHQKLFGSMQQVQIHTKWLTDHLYASLISLRHWNGLSVCTVYGDRSVAPHGPSLAFNLRDAKGNWASNFELEKTASIRDIQLRTGGVCNPGGVAQSLRLSPWEMQSNFSSGQRCGGENDIMNGKPTGVIRVSLGAMSTFEDVTRFVDFISEFFVEHREQRHAEGIEHPQTVAMAGLGVESITIYPIKSCAGWPVPRRTPWAVRREGLAWDREWCLVHQGSGAALSQKRYPKMALLRPELDLVRGVLTVRYQGPPRSNLDGSRQVSVPISMNPKHLAPLESSMCSSSVCGDRVSMLVYRSKQVNDFFTSVLETPCALARFPPTAPDGASPRHAKPHLRLAGGSRGGPMPLLLSNESPILIVSRSSLNKLNETIKGKDPPGRAASASVFRPNVVLCEDRSNGFEQPWVEDVFESVTILPRTDDDILSLPQISSPPQDGNNNSSSSSSSRSDRTPFSIDILSPCRRCQMVCIDPQTGERNKSGEPFATLARTRRVDGKVWFGVHACLSAGVAGEVKEGMIRVVDRVEARIKTMEDRGGGVLGGGG